MTTTRREQRTYRFGDRVPQTGVYSATHAGHRKTHELTLLKAELFPRCAQCGSSVEFTLVFAAPEIEEDKDFRSRKLFEIPHPEAV